MWSAGESADCEEEEEKFVFNKYWVSDFMRRRVQTNDWQMIGFVGFFRLALGTRKFNCEKREIEEEKIKEPTLRFSVVITFQLTS